MPLVLNEEQKQLKDSANDFFKHKSPISELRRLRDNNDTLGYCPELWREISEMGWTGTIIPQQFGGLEFGFVGLGQVLEAAGRTLAATPLFSSIVLSASAIIAGGNQQQKSQLLPKMAKGELLISLALQEHSHHQPKHISTRVTKDGSTYLLNGSKVFVIDGHIADQLIVVTRSQDSTENMGTANENDPNLGKDGISLFLVDSKQAGVSIHRSAMVDSRNAAKISFSNVELTEEQLIGGLHQGDSILENVIDRGNIALCAEMLGALQEAFDRTMNYIKQREQFGEIIGTFQSLQHRASQMFIEIEMCKSVVLKALQAVDDSDPQLSQLASLAKVQVGETFTLVSNEAIQMHGGIGMTDEEEIGFFIKRARVALQTLGD